MDRGSTILLRGAILFIGVIGLIICGYALPHVIISGRAGDYLPVLFGLYLPAVPFFIALFQAMKLLNYIDKNQAFSELSVSAIKYIKNCAALICAVFTGGMPYIFYAADQDDAPGVIMIGLIIIFASFVIATAAAVLQKLVQNAVDIKSENDLTV